MAERVEDLNSSPPNGPEPEVDRSVADLAEAMRGTVTPVIGYLELMSQEGPDQPSDCHLDWIATIERRLATMSELNDQISRICDVMRRSLSDRPVSTPHDPGAPEG